MNSILPDTMNITIQNKESIGQDTIEKVAIHRRLSLSPHPGSLSAARNVLADTETRQSKTFTMLGLSS